MALRLLAVLVTSLMLAGCSSDPQATPADGGASNDADSTTDASAPGASAPTLANVTGSCVGQRTAIGSGLGYGINYDSSDICHLDAALEADVTLYSAGLVELVWSATQATETEVRVVLHSQDCSDTIDPGQGCVLSDAAGTASPLRMELAKGLLAQHGGKDLVVGVSVTGAAVQHEFTVHVSLFNTPHVPPGYTAIAQ